MLPNLLVVGVPKAGTGSLFWYLSQHPDICGSTVKETNYYNELRHEDRSLGSFDWYLQHFAHCEGQRYAMEASVAYWYGGERLQAGIRDTLDRPRIVVSLRDPVERLWSEYTMHRTMGRILKIGSFEEYVSVCEDGRRRGSEGRHMRGLSIGFYADYLPGWYETFPDDVKVVFTEDLFDDPRRVVSDLCRWLAIDDAAVASFDYEVRNPTAHARNPFVGRAVWAAKGMTDGILRRAPSLRSTLRGAYLRLGTGALEEKLEPETRQRVRLLYRESNAAVAAMLIERGYERLPLWLQATEPEHRGRPSMLDDDRAEAR